MVFDNEHLEIDFSKVKSRFLKVSLLAILNKNDREKRLNALAFVKVLYTDDSDDETFQDIRLHKSQ